MECRNKRARVEFRARVLYDESSSSSKYKARPSSSRVSSSSYSIRVELELGSTRLVYTPTLERRKSNGSSSRKLIIGFIIYYVWSSLGPIYRVGAMCGSSREQTRRTSGLFFLARTKWCLSCIPTVQCQMVGEH